VFKERFETGDQEQAYPGIQRMMAEASAEYRKTVCMNMLNGFLCQKGI